MAIQFSPLSHTRWLAHRIAGARMVVEPGASHFAAFPAFPEILAWVTQADRAPRN